MSEDKKKEQTKNRVLLNSSCERIGVDSLEQFMLVSRAEILKYNITAQSSFFPSQNDVSTTRPIGITYDYCKRMFCALLLAWHDQPRGWTQYRAFFAENIKDNTKKINIDALLPYLRGGCGTARPVTYALVNGIYPARPIKTKKTSSPAWLFTYTPLYDMVLVQRFSGLPEVCSARSYER